MENINISNTSHSPKHLQVASSTDSKSTYIYRLLSVQEYLLEQMRSEEDIFKVQDYQMAIFRLDDCIQLMSNSERPQALVN